MRDTSDEERAQQERERRQREGQEENERAEREEEAEFQRAIQAGFFTFSWPKRPPELLVMILRRLKDAHPGLIQASSSFLHL